MQARSALFDLYGDHLRPRGGYAPVAALVRLLTPLQIGGPAVRTAVSRMVRQGWLRPVRLPEGPGYSLTPKAARRVDDAASRIYRTTTRDWTGSFDLLVIDPPTNRTARSRLAGNLAYLGYGRLRGGTWVAPHPGSEVGALLADAAVTAERFTAEPAGGVGAAMALADRAWDLERLAVAYHRFIIDMRPVVSSISARGPGKTADGVGDAAADAAAFVARFTLVHAWRAFLFRDPQLPSGLLPDPWPGTAAAEFFDEHASRLRPAADRHVDAQLANGARPAGKLRDLSLPEPHDASPRRPSPRDSSLPTLTKGAS